MMIIPILSLAFSVLMMILSFVFRLSGKFRLTLPVIWFLLMAIPFHKWASEHEALSLGILAALTLFCIIRWICSLVRSIRGRRAEQIATEARMDYILWQREKAHELGYRDEDLFFDEDGHMRDSRTHKQILF